MSNILSQNKYKELVTDNVPLDKSWLMRTGLLDLQIGSTNTVDFIRAQQHPVSDDLSALANASEQYLNDEENIEVGESATLLRFMKALVWYRKQTKNFLLFGTLKDRSITDSPEILNMPIIQMLKLDGGTSQWASAAVLLGNKEQPPEDAPYKLRLSYEVKEKWSQAHNDGNRMVARLDPTILKQVLAYVIFRQTGIVDFVPEQAEDYCFARAYNLMTAEQGEQSWPALRNHESDRIAVMEDLEKQKVARDHRVVAAAAMRHALPREAFAYPDSVNKSWPRFWDFMDGVSNSHII